MLLYGLLEAIVKRFNASTYWQILAVHHVVRRQRQTLEHEISKRSVKTNLIHGCGHAL